MLTSPLREAVAKLALQADKDLAGLWKQVSDAVAAREALIDVLPALVERYGDAAGVLAATWYDDLRAKQGITGRFEAVPSEVETGGIDALARWGVGPLFQAEPDVEAAKTLVAGGLQRRIADVARTTVTKASLRDLAAAGWQRMGAGGCDFCLLLVARGDVYTKETADFASHDHCHCQAVPIFKGAEPIDVKEYVKSSRKIGAADRTRVRDYLASH